MFTQLMFEFMLIGLIGGLLGIFYRNCLKVDYMIFHCWYVILKGWVKKSQVYWDDSQDKLIEPNMSRKLRGFVAKSLGFYDYYTAFWITAMLLILYLTSWDSLPKWQDIIIGSIAAEGVQHLVICVLCRWLIYKHPDLDKNN